MALTVEVLIVVRAGVIKLLEYPPDRQGYNWLLPELFTDKLENFVNLHVTWAKFWAMLVCSSSRVAHRKGT